MLSFEDVISCCQPYNCGNGCEGGYPKGAWQYMATNGVVTGGTFGSDEGCMPYKFKPCEHVPNKNNPNRTACGSNRASPSCNPVCNKGYNGTYHSDKHYGAGPYIVRGEQEIMRELLSGPVQAMMIVYEDLMTYSGGIYHHTIGGPIGAHSVKLVGWGVQNTSLSFSSSTTARGAGVVNDTGAQQQELPQPQSYQQHRHHPLQQQQPYWIATNSWGADWGADGFFKIRRGVNECQIESLVMTGRPAGNHPPHRPPAPRMQ